MKKWLKAGLIWGMIMFVTMTFIYPYFNNEEIAMKNVLIGFVVWTIGGILFGRTLKNNFKE